MREKPPLLRPSELARFWALHPKTVYLWIREGRLPAVRTPGSQFRVRAQDVRAFCRAHDLAIPPFVSPPVQRLFFVGTKGAPLRAVRKSLEGSGVTISAYATALDGLFASVAAPPQLLCVDASLGGLDLDEALHALRRAKPTAKTPVIVFNASSPSKAEGFVRAGATGALTRDQERELPAWVGETLGR